MRAVQDAAASAGDAMTFLHATEIYDEGQDGSVALKSEIVDLLKASSGPVFSMIGGAAHNSFGILRNGPLMEFIHPRFPDLPVKADAVRVPYEQVRDAISRVAGRWPHLLGAICDVAPGRVVHFDSPPPIGDQTWLTRRLANKFKARGISKIEVNPPRIRFKLWQVNADLYRDMCQDRGAVFEPSPPEAATASGGLAKPYWLGDATHANEAYGALILKRMREYADVASL